MNQVFIGLLLNFILLVSALKSGGDSGEAATIEDASDNQTIPQDLYIFKTIVYEVGILTNANNDTDSANETQEHLDISFYNPLHNGSGIDLHNIPLPIQTNVSGVSVTGLLPANLGPLILPQSASPTPTNTTAASNTVLPNKQVTVTQNISTTDPARGSQIVSSLSQILGLPPFNIAKNESN